MRHDATRQLHAYWDALRGDRAAPGRDEIDPAAIRGILACVFVLDVAAVPLQRAGDATFRLSGTRVDALFGRALRGDTFDRIWSPASSGPAAAALDAVLAERRPRVEAARGAPPARDAVDIEVMLLPLDHGRRPGARVLGSLAAFSTPGWMGLTAVTGLDLAGPQAPRRDGRFGGAGRRSRHAFPLRSGGRDGSSPAPSPV